MMKFKRTPLMALSAALVAGTLGLGLGLMAAASMAADDKSAATAKPALTVTTAQPQQSSLPLKLAANGSVAAWQEASIGAEVNGLRLDDVLVNVGDRVQRGQLLARFATQSVQADLRQARASLLEAQANAGDAAANAERARSVQGTGALSAQQINQYLSAELGANARVEAARAALAAQELRLKNTEVLAPDRGVISARGATVGAVVATGTELFRMIRQERLEWRAEVTAAELARIRPGQAVTLADAGGKPVTGRVRMIAPTVDVQTRSALVYVDLPAASTLRAGMFAKGEFELGSSGALTVPQQAVVVRDGFSYVFKLGADQRVSQVKVQTGRRLSDRIEVLDGVRADAVLVASGAGFLNDGDLVKVVPTK